jgi:hypothetical protein
VWWCGEACAGVRHTAEEIADDFTVLPEASRFVAERDLLRHELVHSSWSSQPPR